MANLLFLFDSIAHNPVAAHTVYTYLATKPEGYRDPEGKLDPDSTALA